MIEWITPTVAGAAFAGLATKLIYDGIKSGRNGKSPYCDQHHKLVETCIKIEAVTYEMNDNVKYLRTTMENVYERIHALDDYIGGIRGDIKVLYSKHGE